MRTMIDEKSNAFFRFFPREKVRNSCVKLSANLAQRDTKSRRCSLYENRDVDIMLDSILNTLRDSVAETRFERCTAREATLRGSGFSNQFVRVLTVNNSNV